MSWADWSMSDAQPGRTLDAPGVVTEYTKVDGQGAAPAVVRAWDIGQYQRAEVADRLVWLTNPDGVHWSDNLEQPPWFAPTGTDPLFVHPLPELQGLRSLHDACAWLDFPELEPAGRLTHGGTGRTAWRHDGDGVRLTEDVATGRILSVSIATRWAFRLDTTSFAMVPRQAVAAAFAYAGPSRPWAGPTTQPL